MNWEATINVLGDAADDWLALDNVRWIVTSDLEPTEGIERDMALTFDVIAPLLSAGYLEVGDVRRTEGFVPWTGSPSENLERLRRGWLEIAAPLRIGDVAWFQITEAGRSRLQELEVASEDADDLPE